MKTNPTYKSLLDKSVSSMLSAIEIYNKPNFQYREESFSILAVNSWELLLKAYILRLNRFRKKSIYVMKPKINKNGSESKRSKQIALNRCGNPMSISIFTALEQLYSMGKLPLNIKDNIEILIELRDNSIHFINSESITKQVQELGFACIKNYIEIIKEWEIEIDLSKYNLYLMPLAYIDEQIIVSGTLTKETENYIKLIKEKLSGEEEGSPFDIAISIDIDFKKGNSFDAINVTYSPDGIPVTISEEDIKKRYPLSYKQVADKCRKRYRDFKQDAKFNRLIQSTKSNNKLSHSLTLYPNNPNAMKSYHYNGAIIKYLDEHYQKK